MYLIKIEVSVEIWIDVIVICCERESHNKSLLYKEVTSRIDTILIKLSDHSVCKSECNIKSD